ncbi:MAG: hypothetical protein ACXAB4_12920 [Candidatus Hodarchaeales archaeon]
MKDISLSVLRQEFPVMEESPSHKIKVPDQIKHKVVMNLIQALADLGGKVSTLDGLRLDFDDGFVLVRAKNTEAAIETRFQAETKTRLASLENEVLSTLENVLGEMS